MKTPRSAAIAGICLFLFCKNAGAINAGDVFSGAIRPTGATMYYGGASSAQLPKATALMIDFTGIVLQAGYQRSGLDPLTGSNYAPAEFTKLAPDLLFTVQIPTAWEKLRIIGGGFNSVAQAGSWPESGPLKYHAQEGLLLGYNLSAGALLLPHPDFAFTVTAGLSYYYSHLRNAIDFGSFLNQPYAPGSEPLPYEDPNLSGWADIRGTALSPTVMAGAFGRPLSWLRLGASVFVPKDPTLKGSIDISSPAILTSALQAYALRPHGKLETVYPMPWVFNGEAEATLGDYDVAILYQFVKSSVRRGLVASISDASVDVLEGKQVSLTNLRNDFTLGARVSHKFQEQWEIGVRADYSPNRVPTQTLSPANLDFNLLEVAAGASYQYAPGAAFVISYHYNYIFDTEVRDSRFNNYAPPSSGLRLPSANGDYYATAHKLTFGFVGLWGL